MTADTSAHTPAPPLTPRTVALAHYAARAVLERVLARHGLSFPQSVTLRPLASAGGPAPREEIVSVVVDALKIPAAEAEAVLDELIEAGHAAADGDTVRLTEAGRALHEKVGAETAPFTARIYAGIPEEELAVTGRVLTLITKRANAELAALRGTAA